MQKMLARRMRHPFSVKAYLCRAFFAPLKLVLSPSSPKDKGPSLATQEVLLPFIDAVLYHVHEIENSSGQTESSILDEVERVMLLEIERRKLVEFDYLGQGWLLERATRTGVTVYVNQKLESDP